ncbi:MAG: hypothetical protein HON04_11000 [Planctomicrobium sp.]|jgi:hypothetical protein|nr:hypothetical protein [Planctomicrobium sp.]
MNKRKRKRSKKRKKSNVPAIFTFPLVLVPVSLVLVLGILFALDVPSKVYRLGGKAFRTVTNTKSTEWPPAEGEKIYGDTFGEQIVEFKENTISYPLRRRSIDPWLEISNASVSFDTVAIKKANFTFDVEKIEPIGEQSFYVFARRKIGPSRGFTRMTSVKFPGSKRRKETLTASLHLLVSPNAEFDSSRYQDWEIYIVANDGNYRMNRQLSAGIGSGPAQFKVSNSFVIGSIDDLTVAREWHPMEKEYLLSKPNGELFLTFEGAEVVSTEPFKIPTAEELRGASSDRHAEMKKKHEEAVARMRAGSSSQNLSSKTNTEFDSNWKMLKPAGGSFDLLVPDDTEMVSTRTIPFGETSIQTKISKYTGRTRTASLRLDWVKYSEKMEPELLNQLLKAPIAAMIPGNLEVIDDSESEFQGFPARHFSVQQGEMISDAKYIIGDDFAMIVIISYKEGRPDDLSKFWDSIEINARK